MRRSKVAPLNKGGGRRPGGSIDNRIKGEEMTQFVRSERHLPYDPFMVEHARQLRKSMTPAEKKLWYDYLRHYPFRVFRQRPIDRYIVDFYCPRLSLVIEIDGETHYTNHGKASDEERDAVLNAY